MPAIELFSFVGLYDHAIVTADHLLTKGVEHAAATGASEEDMLDWRLIDTMQPLRFQLAVVANFAARWPARVAAIALPDEVSDRLDVAGFRAAFAGTRAFLATLKPEPFEGRDDAPLTFAIQPGMEPTMPAGRWLSLFATTNLHFHLTMAYAILRAKGAPLGKADMFAGGL